MVGGGARRRGRSSARRLRRGHVRACAAPVPRGRDPGQRAAQRSAPGARRHGRASASALLLLLAVAAVARRSPHVATRTARRSGAHVRRRRLRRPRARRLRPRLPRRHGSGARRPGRAARGRRRPSERRAGVGRVLALAAVAAAAVVSLVLPDARRARRSRAVTSADAGRVEEAVDAADRARRLDPLSIEPLHARAIAADAAGDEAAAVAWYEEATSLQPENPDTWYELGLYHAIATGDQCAAYQALNHSYTLDPKSRRWSPGGVLDVARDAVNDGACERSGARRRESARRGRRGAVPGRMPSSGADDADAESRGARRRASPSKPRPVHDERRGVVSGRRVRDEPDPVAAYLHAARGRRCGALTSVAVQDNDLHLPSRQLRGRRLCNGPGLSPSSRLLPSPPRGARLSLSAPAWRGARRRPSRAARARPRRPPPSRGSRCARGERRARSGRYASGGPRRRRVSPAAGRLLPAGSESASSRRTACTPSTSLTICVTRRSTTTEAKASASSRARPCSRSIRSSIPSTAISRRATEILVEAERQPASAIRAIGHSSARSSRRSSVSCACIGHRSPCRSPRRRPAPRARLRRKTALRRPGSAGRASSRRRAPCSRCSPARRGGPCRVDARLGWRHSQHAEERRERTVRPVPVRHRPRAASGADGRDRRRLAPGARRDLVDPNHERLHRPSRRVPRSARRARGPCRRCGRRVAGPARSTSPRSAGEPDAVAWIDREDRLEVAREGPVQGRGSCGSSWITTRRRGSPAMPSTSPIDAVKPSSVAACDGSSTLRCASPARGGSNRGGAVTPTARSQMRVELGDARLDAGPDVEDPAVVRPAASSSARTTSSTWTKSRVIVPSPKIAVGSPASSRSRKIAITPPSSAADWRGP